MVWRIIGGESGDSRSGARHASATGFLIICLINGLADHWRRVWRLAVRRKTRKRNWIPDYLSDQWFD
jgi:hypothetical protein